MRLGFPCRSYDCFFLYTQCPQTMTLIVWTNIKQPVSSLLPPLPVSKVLAHSFPQDAASLGWEAQGSRTRSPLSRHSLHSPDHPASPMFVLPFATWVLFPLTEDTEAHKEAVRSLSVQCHSQHIIFSFKTAYGNNSAVPLSDTCFLQEKRFVSDFQKTSEADEDCF